MGYILSGWMVFMAKIFEELGVQKGWIPRKCLTRKNNRWCGTGKVQLTWDFGATDGQSISWRQSCNFFCQLLLCFLLDQDVIQNGNVEMLFQNRESNFIPQYSSHYQYNFSPIQFSLTFLCCPFVPPWSPSFHSWYIISHLYLSYFMVILPL